MENSDNIFEKMASTSSGLSSSITGTKLLRGALTGKANYVEKSDSDDEDDTSDSEDMSKSVEMSEGDDEDGMSDNGNDDITTNDVSSIPKKAPKVNSIESKH